MEKEKRYTVTIDLYIYEKNDDDAKKEAQKIINVLNGRDDCRADVLSIFETPFASFEKREVK